VIPVLAGVRVWLATGHTDMRKGFDGAAAATTETQGWELTANSAPRRPRNCSGQSG
jgi:hypothetical protein